MPASPIDTAFDVRSDAGGRDPDGHSQTLRRYHRLLWSKALPGGAMFDLDARLRHASHLGEFALSSDSIIHTYSTWTEPERLAAAVRQVPPAEAAAFLAAACTIGGYIVFPAPVRADGKWHMSINQARGLHPRIRDRFDLTLECIRRHYLGQDSPLRNALAWHDGFLQLFGDFRGYVDYFLLQDLVHDDYTSVLLFTDAVAFEGDPLPAGSAGEYREYMRRSMDFVEARNRRIRDYASTLTAAT